MTFGQWWDKQTFWVRYGIIGGGLLLVAVPMFGLDAYFRTR